MSESLVLIWKQMFRRKKYVAVLLVSGFLFYLLNGFLANVLNIKTFYQVLGFGGAAWALFYGALQFIMQVDRFSAVSIVILSFLVGFLIALLTYRYDLKVGGKAGGVFGSVGLFLGAAAPGCAACGVGIVSVLGFGSALAALPFGGHEVIVIAILIVGFSVYSVTKKFYKGCDISQIMHNQKPERGSKRNE